jgi:hypothetical protein
MPRKRPIDYILPFLIMICAGIIVVLAYQLWNSLQPDENDRDIYMYIAKGNAKILPWGAGEWERAYNGTRLLQGDSLKTQRGGRVVIEFFKDHYIRMDEKTEIILNEIKKNNGSYEINLMLQEGAIWVNNNENSEIPVKFTLKTPHTLIKTVGTVYEVENLNAQEVIRVVKGSIIADILIDENGEKKKIETISIGVGQQAVIDEKDLAQYAKRMSPSVLEALSDNFKDGDFYKWNMAEDQNPSDFSLKGPSYNEDFLNEPATPDVETESANGTALATPVITTPSTLNFTTSESSLTIRGTTAAKTEKMMVDVYTGAEKQTYELNLYVPGNMEWSFAISEAAGTMKAGANTYKFYALDKDGIESPKSSITIVYKGSDDSEDVEKDLGPLTAPKVETFNGSQENTVETDTVKVVGSVSGAEKIIVNGYTLKAFEAGDSTWVYYAKESLGNLKPGENSYTVKAVAPDGSEKSTEFSIVYNKQENLEEDEAATPDVENTES